LESKRRNNISFLSLRRLLNSIERGEEEEEEFVSAG